MQLGSRYQIRVHDERNRNAITQGPTQPGAPRVGRLRWKRRCGHHRESTAVRKLSDERIKLRLGERLEVLFDPLDPRFRAKLRWHLGKQSPRKFGTKVKSAPPKLGERVFTLCRERLSRCFKERLRLAFGLGAAGLRRSLRLGCGSLECGFTLRRYAGAFRFNLGEISLRLVFDYLGLIVLFLDSGFARVDHAQHRLVKEAMQQPDQDREIDGLQRQCPPIEVHGQCA
ncbi:MAG: hypothetical protein WA884_05230 [Methyloceanibacter sp.]